MNGEKRLPLPAEQVFRIIEDISRSRHSPRRDYNSPEFSARGLIGRTCAVQDGSSVRFVSKSLGALFAPLSERELFSHD